MADMRGKHLKGKRKVKRHLGRPPGSKTLFTYSEEELKGLPREAKLLTPAELKVIKGMLDPEIQSMNESEKCKAIGVCRKTYYTALKNPIIIEILNEQALSMIRADAMSLIRASIKFAKEKSSAFQDRKMLYQMLGYIGDDRNIVNVNVDDNKIEDPYDGLSKEQLEVLINNINANVIEVDDVREVQADGRE